MKDQFLKLYDSLTDREKETMTVWDLFLLMLNIPNFDKWLLTLRVDLELVEKLADGISPMYLARMYNLKTSDVYSIAKLWGISVFDASLDFSPVGFYKKGMTPSKLMEDVNPVLSRKLSLNDYKKIVSNLERYYDLVEVLKEYASENI